MGGCLDFTFCTLFLCWMKHLKTIFLQSASILKLAGFRTQTDGFMCLCVCVLHTLVLFSVFNWTNQDVLNWLEHYVELPQYSGAFIENQITGRHLPFIAINSGQILQNTLSITDGQHKQKIQLRAMDVILFGPPVQRGRWKETILEIAALLMVCGMAYVLWQRRLSKAHMDSFMEDLRLKEEEINRLRSKFEAIERESTDAPGIDCQEDPSPPIMMSPTPNSSDGSEDDSASICK